MENKGHFKPGQSGNPGGRPAVVKEVRGLAQTHTLEAIATYVRIMKDPKAPHAAQVAAASALLDRGYGRPPQALTGLDGDALVIKVIKFADYAIGDNDDENAATLN